MPAAPYLKNVVPGWGADLDPSNRPASRKEANRESVLDSRGAGEYEVIPRQTSHVEVLVSTEHKKLTPIYSTVCPPKGLSGIIRRLAFRYSEGKKQHWLLLLFADRIDVYESALGEIIRGKLPNPYQEMGLKTEFGPGGFMSRFGRDRADTKRWRQEAVLLGVTAAVAIAARRKLRKAA